MIVKGLKEACKVALINTQTPTMLPIQSCLLIANGNVYSASTIANTQTAYLPFVGMPSICPYAGAFVAALNAFSDDADVELSQKDGKVKLKSGRTSIDVDAEDPASFPMKDMQDVNFTSIEYSVFKKGYDKAVPYTLDTDTHVLSNVWIGSQEGKIKMFASDSASLIVIDLGEGELGDCAIPREIGKFLPKLEGVVKFGVFGELDSDRSFILSDDHNSIMMRSHIYQSPMPGYLAMMEKAEEGANYQDAGPLKDLFAAAHAAKFEQIKIFPPGEAIGTEYVSDRKFTTKIDFRLDCEKEVAYSLKNRNKILDEACIKPSKISASTPIISRDENSIAMFANVWPKP